MEIITYHYESIKASAYSCVPQKLQHLLRHEYKYTPFTLLVLYACFGHTSHGIISRAGMINHSILQILLIIDCKSVMSIMLIIPKDILFKHATANNVQY